MEDSSQVKELFIVGNGLDLKADLGSTYHNFLKSVGDIPSNNDTEIQDEHQFFEGIPDRILNILILD